MEHEEPFGGLADQAALVIGRHRMRKFAEAMNRLETEAGVPRGDLPALTQGILQLSGITGTSTEDIESSTSPEWKPGG